MEYLALTALGKNQIGILNEITNAIKTCECHIVISNATILGAEFSCSLFISGTWNAIAKLEAHLPHLETKHGLHFLWNRTSAQPQQTNALPYTVYAIGLDSADLVTTIVSFFAEQNLEVYNLSSDLYQARYSGLTMCSLNMSLCIPTDMVISDLRERFILFCDRFNIDGIIEPEKN